MRRPAIVQRLLNSARKAGAGLTLHGECVWPGVRNDVYVAHESIYSFFARFVTGRKVLDAGCGCGYGTALLAAAGASQVHGIDSDSRNVRYARRNVRSATVSFAVGDCEHLDEALTGVDVVTASNVLEHLESPSRFLAGAKQVAGSRGMLLVAVPPIINDELERQNDAIPYHRSNLWVDEWIRLFEGAGFTWTSYRHVVADGAAPLDFSSPHPTTRSVADFSFPEATRDDLYSLPTLTALFRLQP